MFSATLDNLTGNIIHHGTLSKYRNEAISVEQRTESFNAHVQDNFLTLTFQCDNDRDAFTRGSEWATKICVLLTSSSSRLFYPEFLQLVNLDNRTRVRVPVRVNLMTTTIYNLETMSTQLREAVNLSVFDERLEKAGSYYGYAMLLDSERLVMTDTIPYRAYMVTSQIILNCYKAISSLIGEPGVDRDAQTRYRDVGISRELWDESEKVRGLRNDFDVAHYSPDWKSSDELGQNARMAQAVARQVIEAYRRWRIGQLQAAALQG